MHQPQAHGSSPQAVLLYKLYFSQKKKRIVGGTGALRKSMGEIMGEIFTNICDVDDKCRQSFGIYQSDAGNSNLNSGFVFELYKCKI